MTPFQHVLKGTISVNDATVKAGFSECLGFSTR